MHPVNNNYNSNNININLQSISDYSRGALFDDIDTPTEGTISLNQLVSETLSFENLDTAVPSASLQNQIPATSSFDDFDQLVDSAYTVESKLPQVPSRKMPRVSKKKAHKVFHQGLASIAEEDESQRPKYPSSDPKADLLSQTFDSLSISSTKIENESNKSGRLKIRKKLMKKMYRRKLDQDILIPLIFIERKQKILREYEEKGLKHFKKIESMGERLLNCLKDEIKCRKSIGKSGITSETRLFNWALSKINVLKFGQDHYQDVPNPFKNIKIPG